MKHLHPSVALAIWFRTEVQGEEFAFNHPTCRFLMKQAKDLVNPQDGVPIPEDDVRRAVTLAVDTVRKRQPWFKPNSLHIIQWTGEGGKTFFDLANEVPPMPPIYEKISVLAWLDKYGERALGKDKADEIRSQL